MSYQYATKTEPLSQIERLTIVSEIQFAVYIFVSGLM